MTVVVSLKASAVIINSNRYRRFMAAVSVVVYGKLREESSFDGTTPPSELSGSFEGKKINKNSMNARKK